MAQIQELYDRFTSETVYPTTVTGAILCPDSSRLETRLQDHEQTLDLLNTRSVPADEQLESIEPNIVTEALRKTPQILTPSEQNQVLTNLGHPEYTIFIDQWNTACGTYGRYDPDNAPDPEHPFYLNTLWLTYKEATKCYVYTLLNFMQNQVDFYATNHVITNIPIVGGSMTRISNSFNWSTPRCFNFVRWLPQQFLVSLNSCTNLETILNLNFEYCTSVDSNFLKGAVNLKTLDLSNLKISIDIKDSPLISLASIRYMIDHAANTSAITITVHPDIYARLTDTANTEWHPLLTAAAARQITFATV